jgi:hypothetical protein
MLIYIDSSLMLYFQESKYTTEDLDALDNIVSSHRKGYHYVLSDRKCLEFLSQLDGLSPSSKRQLQMLSHDYTTLAGIRNNVSSKIVIKPPNFNLKRIDSVIESGLQGYSYTTSIFEIPLRDFLSSEFLYKTRLVAEHLHDCYFYEFIGNEFSKIKGLPCNLAFDHLHGGGSDTHRILEDKIINNHIVFALVDSDKKDPMEEIGTTAKQVVKVYEQYKENAIVGCEVLPVHEKENLFSSTVYEYLGYNVKPTAIQQLKLLEEYDNHGIFYPFIDLKEGLHSENYRSYFEPLFDIPDLIPRIEDQGRKFDNEFIGTKEDFLRYHHEQKNLEKRSRTKKYLIEPLGSNPLSEFELEKLKKRLFEELKQLNPSTPDFVGNKIKNKIQVLENLLDYLLTFQKQYFEILGTQIKEWGLSNPKRSAS